jgi:hypothetical protein
MSSARRCLLSLALCCSLLLTLSAIAQNQTPLAPQKLSLTAVLVLTPEFCATVFKGGNLEKYLVGKTACIDLEPVLKGIFTSLTRVDDSSKAGDAQVVLEPKFSDAHATGPGSAWTTREMVVLVEWTARDQSGKAVWIETVQGSAKYKTGNVFQQGSHVKHLVEDSVQNMAEQSAVKISSSPQLLKLSAGPVK